MHYSFVYFKKFLPRAKSCKQLENFSILVSLLPPPYLPPRFCIHLLRITMARPEKEEETLIAPNEVISLNVYGLNIL